MSIAYNTGVTGSFGAPLPGMTVQFGTSSGGSDLGVARLRSWTPAGTSGVISVGENDDVTPYVVSGNFIRIGAQWRLWPIYPRALISGNNAIIFTDYDVAFSDQTILYKPVAVVGTPAVVEYNGTNAQASFVGDRSFALALGATITGYLWTAPGSVQGSSTSQGTEASPVTFTWTSTGQKLVYLRVTDSNGKTATNYTWVFVVDPNNPETVAYVNFDSYNDNFDFEQGGGSCTFTVHGSATIADFPNEAMIVMASRPTTPGQTTPTGYWPNRDNVHFVGYIVGNTVRQNPISGDVTFTAVTIDTLMRNVTAFPISLTYRNAPQDWTMAANLTTDRAASYLWHYHSTLSLMTSIRPSNYAGLIQRQDFGPNGGIFSQLDSELMSSLWGKVVVNHQGVVHHLIDYNLMNDTERAAVTVRKTLHKGVWVDDLNIEERHTYSLPVNVVKMSGVLYPGGEIDDVCPLFSESPGNAPKVYGSEMNYDRLILTSQTDLNVRCGRALAKQNAKYSAFGMRFINDGSFAIAPQELFPSNIEAADNDRGLALTTRLLPRRISRTFDNQNMLISYDVGFEPETDGPPGVTVDLPCGPPEQKLPTNRPPGTPSDTSGANSLASSTEGNSFYFAQKTGQVWQRRVSGLTSLNLQDMIKDPWSDFKNGHSIDHIILWGCGTSFLTRSPDTGQNWEDHTPYLDSPPNSWGDATAPNITGTVIKQVLGDLFREDTLYLLAQNQGTGTVYRGWIGRSTDAGFTFSWFALTGTAQTYPIRMDIDKQDSTLLWVTDWEANGNINLRKYGIAGGGLTLSSTITLQTGTVVFDVIANTYTAAPFAPLGNKNQIYIYGRLNNPQGLTGTVAVMQSSNAGGAWSALANDWGTDFCGTFFAGEAGSGGNRQLYAVRNSPSVAVSTAISQTDAAVEIVSQQLSSTRAMVAYAKTTGSIKFAWVDITSNPPTILSTVELAPASTTITHISMHMASSTQCVVVFRNKNGADYTGFAMIVSVSGDVISHNAASGAAYLGVSASARPTENSVAVVSSTKAMVVFRVSATQSQGCVLDLNLATNTITANTAADIVTTSAANFDVCEIDATTALCTYLENIAGDIRLKCNVLDAIGTGFTLGTQAEIDTDDPFDSPDNQHYLVNVGAGAYLAWQSHSGSLFLIKNATIAVSGSTATPSSPVNLTTGAHYESGATTAGSGVVVYDDQNAVTTVLSSGGLSTTVLNLSADIKSADGANIVLAYVDNTDSNKAKVMVLG